MKTLIYTLSATMLVTFSAPAFAGPKQDAILGYYKELAKRDFSASRGEAFFRAKRAGGKPATPSCTTCHTSSPANTGRTRVNKPIEPMALSKTPGRYSDLKKVEKWFGRNCRSVLGRECTALEKGDYLTFMFSQ